MGDLLTGLVKGLSGFMPQDDPDVKIFNAQTEIKEINEKIEKVYARLGRELYQKDGGEGFPLIRAELDMLVANQAAAREKLQMAKDEKAIKEKAAEEERARQEIYNCPNCGTFNPDGTKFCCECGTRLRGPEPVAQKRFCTSCGNEIAPGQRFCTGCGTKVE